MTGVLAQINLGVLPQWLIFIGVLAAGWIFWRGGGGTAVRNLQDANRALVDEQGRLKKDLEAATLRIVTLTGDLALLAKRTDFAEQLKPLMDWSTQHEVSDQSRHLEVSLAFTTIADELKAFDGRSEARAKRLSEESHETMAKLLALMGMIAERLGPDNGSQEDLTG